MDGLPECESQTGGAKFLDFSRRPGIGGTSQLLMGEYSRRWRPRQKVVVKIYWQEWLYSSVCLS